MDIDNFVVATIPHIFSLFIFMYSKLVFSTSPFNIIIDIACSREKTNITLDKYNLVGKKNKN